jgi:hypothetical protein
MTVPLQQHLRKGSGNYVQYTRVIIEFLAVEKESMINIHKHLFSVHGSTTLDRSTNGQWAKRVIASNREKRSSIICLAQAILAWLLVLKYCSMLMP